MAAASVFICHARPDAAFAEDLAVALETCRLSVWRDTRNLRGGDCLALEVRWAIEQARQVIVVLGLNTGEAPWMRREIELAQEVERREANAYRVIPLLLPGLDRAMLGAWFAPAPHAPPLHLTAEGLGAMLPELLATLGEPPPSDPPSERSPPPLAELELTFDHAGASCASPWRLAARLNRYPESTSTGSAHLTLGSLPHRLDPDIVRWYLSDYPRWPTEAVRQFARRTEALFGAWGQTLYQATLAPPAIAALVAEWREAPGPCQRRLTLRTADQSPAATLLDLPWELLGDAAGFLLEGRQPVQFQRRLGGGGEAFPPAPPPLRILSLSPRPDTEPTGHPDYRRSAKPLLEALDRLGALTEVQVLTPATLATLERQLNDAWAAGRPFTAVHLDGYFRRDPEQGAALFGFEASDNPHAPHCRDAQFVPVATLATLLASYRIRLVALVRPEETVRSVKPADLASALLTAGIAAVIAVHPDTPPETLHRFWAAFYDELLRGARVSQAVSVGQRRLAGDSYRVRGLGGGDVCLRDWPAFPLYLGQRDPRLALRPPLELWRRLASRPQALPVPGALPVLPPTGCLGRGCDLLIVERLLESRPAVFVKGPGGSGKTTLAAELAGWLARIGRYRHIACAGADDASNPRVLLETLGRQLLPAGDRWRVDRYPTLRQALAMFRQTLRPHPTLIVLDQIECWPIESDEAFDRFWEDLLNEWPGLRLLALGRTGPPSFARPWIETRLAPLEERDAITLIGQALIATGQAPPLADSGASFQQLRELAALAGGHPGALLRLAREIGARGANAALALVRPLRAELLHRQKDDPQWPLYLALALDMRRLSASDRDSLTILAFFKGGVHRIALSHALELDTSATQALCARFIALGLAEDGRHGHLRFDPALARYLSGQLDPNARAAWLERWRNGMEHFLAELYQQYFKDGGRAKRLLRLELPNLLALLRDIQQRVPTERTARIASQLEQLLASLGSAAALAEAAAARERAGQALLGWSQARFETERLRIERLRDKGALEEALQTARQLLRQCQEAGTDAYPGAAYDRARAHFQLGKLLKGSSAPQLAAWELGQAHQQFQALADAGNASAARLAAVAAAEAGDCLSYLRRLQEATAAYEAALARVAPNAVHSTVATNQLRLGLVRQQRGQYVEAAVLYDAARRAFETLGETEGAARAWRQLGLVRKLTGETEPALEACQQALYLYEQQRNHTGVAETLDELAHLYQVLDQLEEAARTYRRMADLYAELGDSRGEEVSRNKLANVLMQLQRHDEARQELHRASERNPLESTPARTRTRDGGLRDGGPTVESPGTAAEARRRALQKYLAYRRAGGENPNPGSRLCAQIGQAIRAGDTAPLVAKLAQIMASSNVPAAGKLLIAKLQAILAGSRDPALAADPNLHYQYAGELQLLLEDLARS